MTCMYGHGATTHVYDKQMLQDDTVQREPLTAAEAVQRMTNTVPTRSVQPADVESP